jgi:hypothetical protein
MNGVQNSKKGSPGIGKHDNMFPIPQWRDTWAAILFYIHAAVFIGISVYAFIEVGKLARSPSNRFGGIADEEKLSAIMIAVSFSITAITSMILSVVGLGAMYKAPERMLHGCFLANIALTFAVSILCFVRGVLLGGIVFLLLAVVSIIFYVVFRKRIPFSALILRTVIDGLVAYPSMLAASGGSLLFSIFYMIYWTATIGSLGFLNKEQIGGSNPTWMLIYSAFSLFWTSQVITNTTQTIIAGVYATYYFLHGTGQTIASPVIQSMKRAVSYSFGSICFGSLLVATIQTIRFLLQMANDRDSIAGAIVDCCLSLIQGLVEYFNYYAYTQVAIYGKPYLKAAQDTWSLVKSRGVDAIVNDNVIGTCTSLLSLAIGVICGVLVFFVVKVFYGKPNEISITMGVIALILSLIISAISLQIINWGATTTFVCLAEDPESLQRTKPELYRAIMERYSQFHV